MRTTMVLGQPSWHIASSEVEVCVTELGGHVAPVTFDREGGRFAPMAVAPWAEEPVVDAALRFRNTDAARNFVELI